MPPATEPPGAKTNWSRLPAAPSRRSKPSNERPPTVPAPRPVTCQVLSAPGPCSASFAPPARRDVTPAKEMDAPPPDTLPAPPSHTNEEPDPPVTVRLPLPPPSYPIDVEIAPPDTS